MISVILLRKWVDLYVACTAAHNFIRFELFNHCHFQRVHIIDKLLAINKVR